MIGLLFFFVLWCVIVGFLVRWEESKKPKLTEIQIAFYSAIDAIKTLSIAFQSLIEPTRKAAKSIEDFGKAFEGGTNVSE